MESKGILAVIPARAGSKRLPNKNMRLLNGKPLIQWTIDAALKSKYIDDVIVSSDSSAIIELANKVAMLAPFKRPFELATDTAKSIDVALHALKYAEDNKCKYKYIVLLQPTSPLRTSEHIDEAIEFVLKNKLESCVSVCEAEHSPLWCSLLDINTHKLNFDQMEGKVNARSQDLPVFYRLNGAMYITKTEVLRETEQFFSLGDCTPFVMSQESSIDIDTKLDFIVAQTVMESSWTC